MHAGSSLNRPLVEPSSLRRSESQPSSPAGQVDLHPDLLASPLRNYCQRDSTSWHSMERPFTVVWNLHSAPRRVCITTLPRLRAAGPPFLHGVRPWHRRSGARGRLRSLAAMAAPCRRVALSAHHCAYCALVRILAGGHRLPFRCGRPKLLRRASGRLNPAPTLPIPSLLSPSFSLLLSSAAFPRASLSMHAKPIRGAVRCRISTSSRAAPCR